MIITQILLSFFSTLLGALCFRIRGGAFGDFIRRKIYSNYGATTSRLIVWSLPMTLMFFFSHPFHA